MTAQAKALQSQTVIEQETLQSVNLGQHFQITPQGLTIVGRPTFDQFESLGETLRTLDRCLQFAVGDFFRAVEDRYPEKSSQILDHTGWSESTLRVYRNTAKNVAPATRRMDKLTYTHHQVVAALPPKKQKEWLNRAADTDERPWSVNRLRKAISVGEDLPVTAWFVLARCDTEAKRDKLMKELEGRGFMCSATERRGDKKEAT